MLITIRSSLPIDQIAERLPEVCARHKFGVLNVHDLRATLREKGQEFDRPCLVFDVCNPVKANTVLTAAPHVAAALPCRIAAVEEEGGTTLVAMRPSMLMQIFPGDGLEETANDVEQTMQAIMEETAEPARD